MQLDLEPFRDPHKTRSMGSSFNKHQKYIYKTEAWRGRLSWMPKAAPLLKGCEDLLSSPSPPLLQPAQPSHMLPASSCVCRFLSVVYIRTMVAIWNGSHCKLFSWVLRLNRTILEFCIPSAKGSRSCGQEGVGEKKEQTCLSAIHPHSHCIHIWT